MNTHRFLFFIMSVFLFTGMYAQKTMDCMQLLTVNENITTVITASEPVRFVDISTDKVVGDQPISNTIRLKPKEGVEVNRDGDILGVVTIVTERYRSQYGLVYTSRPEEAVTDKCWMSAPVTTILPSASPRRTWRAMPDGYGSHRPRTSARRRSTKCR